MKNLKKHLLLIVLAIINNCTTSTIVALNELTDKNITIKDRPVKSIDTKQSSDTTHMTPKIKASPPF